MVTVEDFSRVVAAIYAAPLGSPRWQDALRDIHRTLDGTMAGLFMTDGAGWSLENTTLPARAAQSYAEYYYRLDRVLVAVECGPPGVVRTGSELMPLVRKSEFYEDWLSTLNIDDGLFVRLTGESRPTSLIVAAPRGTEAFDTSDRLKLMRGLVPHLQQALRIQNRLTEMSDRSAEMAGALDVVRHGIVVVTGDHLVLNLNSAAERVFRGEDGLRMRSGRIAATSVRADRELNVAMQRALADEPSAVRTGQSLTCDRPSGKRPYVIHVLPSHRCDAEEPHSQPIALVLIIDPDDEPEPPTALLHRLYHLTRAEADVALRVLHGADLREISAELSVSLPTVRTHLQHVFDKTDTHRQAELVRLLLVLCP